MAAGGRSGPTAGAGFLNDPPAQFRLQYHISWQDLTFFACNLWDFVLLHKAGFSTVNADLVVQNHDCWRASSRFGL